MKRNRSEIIAWVGCNIVPYEADLRAWLRRAGASRDEIDDIVQDAYVRISQLASVDHIRNARAYFFTAARSAMLTRIRQDRIVRIDSILSLEALDIEDAEPGPDRHIIGRQELERVRALINALPDRCREIFWLRRVERVPQREIAQRMGLSEHVVEQQAVRGLKLLSQALTESEAGTARLAQGTMKGREAPYVK